MNFAGRWLYFSSLWHAWCVIPAVPPKFRVGAANTGSVLISGTKAFDRKGRKGLAKVAKEAQSKFGHYPYPALLDHDPVGHI
jgi:hypothetical protein